MCLHLFEFAVVASVICARHFFFYLCSIDNVLHDKDKGAF